MKVVILCGGLGSRLGEETATRPKPMVEIGARPILWHIMKIYATQGFADFVIALGHKGEIIKDYFLNYRAYASDCSIKLDSGEVEYFNEDQPGWSVRLQDTGLNTMTGGRLGRLESHLRPLGSFMMTYGDGVADLDLSDLIECHRRRGRIATVTIVRPPGRFGTVALEGDLVTEFKEKPQAGAGWINGGFFVFEPEIFDYISGDETILEADPLERLAADGQLAAYRHTGYWQCMDTVRDRNVLDQLWRGGSCPWKNW